MESLFLKLGSFRALVPASTGKPCEGSCDSFQVAQTPPRSVQICACRAQSPSVTSSTPSPTDEATSTHGSFFNPLPLLSSPSAIPTPLKFLWFNRNNQQTTERDQDLWASGGTGGDEESMLSNDTETSSERECGKESEVSRLTENQEFFYNSDVHGPRENLIESKGSADGVLANEKILNVLKLDLPANMETLDDVTGDVYIGDMEEKLNLCKGDGNQLSSGTNSSDNLVNTSSSVRHDRSPISRITDIVFWIYKKQSTSTYAPSQEPDSASSNSSLSGSEAACHTPQSTEAEEKNCVLGCSLEIPYTKVQHTKESFSKFLQDAPLHDMKIFMQLAFLCDMAYMIPDIQPGELMKYHHLRLVTSSIEKKAEAESKAKEYASSMKPSESTPVKPSAVHRSALQTDASVFAEEQKGPSPEGKQGQNILSTMVKNKGVNEDSIMTIAPVMATVLTENETRLAVAKDPRSSHSSPCEWFACDESSTYTRMFIIQGSESLASWQTNLFFEPTKFEELDVYVHRGIYEAANAMYDEVLPEVLAHISTYGDLARARFTGHSLGGSLAILLALMFQIRGVLPRTAILPVVTFGSPCIMCGGDYLLQKLKLPSNHIQSVMMHRDVVPRAFACDYPDHVAEVLKRLNGQFRDHPCLNNQKLLYAPMGQIFILQPNENAAPPHPLLPDGHGLYVLRHPMNGDGIENAVELRGAQRAFLNMPHPLDILSDPGAYGFDGAISRDHDPQSYVRTIYMVIKHEVKRLRQVQREQRRQLWWPLVLAKSSSLVQKGISSGVNRDHSKTTGALTSSIRKPLDSLSVL